MFRDTEALRELLRRWCPSTHTFFFSWGELTPTLEDVANHWMLPILGEHSLSNIKLSAAEEEIAAVLKKHSFHQTECYIYAARDRSAAWGRFSDLPQKFLNQFPSFRDNLPLVYRWVGLKPCDHDLVDALDYEENVLFRPYGDDHPGFTCASIFRKLYRPSPLIRDLKVDDYRSLSYLSTVNPGFLPILSATGVAFIPYCPQRVQRQFGLDQDIPIGPQETTSCVADLTAFLKSSAFARWGGETTRVLIPGGHRFGFNTPSMGAYWQRLTQSMVDYVIAGRSDRTPMSVHRKPLVSNPYLTPPSQSAISYANSQKLGFAEWDSVRRGWIPYTIHLPDGWRSSVSVVEDRLIMPSKRGKGSKRDAPADPVFEKTPKKSAPTASSSKKAPSKKAKAVKQGKSPPLVSSAAEESTTAFVQGSTKSVVAPPKRKTKAGKESKSTPSVPSTAEESTGAPLEEPIESTGGPSKKTKVGKKSKSTTSVSLAAKESIAAPVKESVESTIVPSKPKSASPTKQIVEKSAASGPPRGQKKASISSSTDEEEPSAVSTPSPLKKKFTAPLFPLGAAGRTRSKSGPRVAHGSGGSVPRREDAPKAAAVDQTEDLGKSAADSPGIGIESTGGDHSSSSGSLFDSVPGSVPEEQIVSAESTADDDDMPEADDSSMGAAGSMEEDLAIVPHASHDDDSAVDADVDPISFSLPQTVLTSAGSDVSISHVMEGISLFGVTPSLRAIPAGGFVIPASHLTSEDSPVVGGALMPEETHAQSLVESGSVVDLGVDAAGHDAPIEDAGISAVDTLAGSDHLENIVSVPWTWLSSYGKFLFHGLGCRPMESYASVDLVVVFRKAWMMSVHVPEEIDEVGITGEFDARTPNPHPEQFFWSFNGPLVPFGDFWVPNDCSPYLSRLSAGHSDFTKGFKLSIGLGGPMMSLLGSVLAAMDESSLEDATKAQILAWRSVIQDLMDVGFDLGFMMERLRQMAQRLFGKRLADEIKALQHQIALLQDSLAELTAYQDAMMSTGGMVPRSERGGSFLDSLLD
uniref:Aminotransferase-like plant mobile domain-containing protein n=1 Tax=Fagus sylvatica TaxID=28930 RepID=A0A2N9G8B0_FAGSY